MTALLFTLLFIFLQVGTVSGSQLATPVSTGGALLSTSAWASEEKSGKEAKMLQEEMNDGMIIEPEIAYAQSISGLQRAIDPFIDPQNLLMGRDSIIPWSEFREVVEQYGELCEKYRQKKGFFCR